MPLSCVAVRVQGQGHQEEEGRPDRVCGWGQGHAAKKQEGQYLNGQRRPQLTASGGVVVGVGVVVVVVVLLVVVVVARGVVAVSAVAVVVVVAVGIVVVLLLLPLLAMVPVLCFKKMEKKKGEQKERK